MGMVLAPALVAGVNVQPRLAAPAAAGLLVLVTALSCGLTTAGGALIGAAMFTAPMSALRPVPSVPFLTLSDVFVVAGLMALIPRLLASTPTMPRTFVVGAGLLSLTSLGSATVALDPAAHLSYAPRLLLGAVIVPVLFARWRPSLGVLRFLAASYTAGTILGLSVGLLAGTAVEGREYGLTTHPNFLAVTGQTALAFCLFLYSTGGPISRVVAPVLAVPALAAIVSSGSRSALLAVAVAGLIYPLVARSARAVYALLAGAIVATLLVQRALTTGNEGSAIYRLLVGTESTKGSDKERQRALQSGWEDFLAHPWLGRGFHGDLLDTHNIYLQVGQGLGVLGLVGFLLITWSMIRTVLGTHQYAILGYPALVYALVGHLQPTLWDLAIWLTLAPAAVAMARYPESDEQVPETPQMPASPPAINYAFPHSRSPQ